MSQAQTSRDHREGSTSKTKVQRLRLRLKKNKGEHLHCTSRHKAGKLEKEVTAVFRSTEREFTEAQAQREDLDPGVTQTFRKTLWQTTPHSKHKTMPQ